MRPIVTTILCAFAAAGVTAPALAASGDYFLKLGDIKATTAAKDERHKDEIEILSWSWGETRAHSGGGHGTGKVNVHDISISRAAGGKVEHEWKVEEGESAPPAPGGVRVASGDVDGDGRADKYGAVGGMHRDDGVAAPRDAASGQATGKRQHLPIRARTYAAPLDRGAVRIKVKFPWTGCRVGARYPVISLGEAARNYLLQDVTVASCGSASTAGGESLPMEEVSFNYAKVTVRAWDPATKKDIQD